jgi:hypothetical protein
MDTPKYTPCETALRLRVALSPSLPGQGKQHPDLPSALPPATAGAALQGVRWAASASSFLLTHLSTPARPATPHACLTACHSVTQYWWILTCILTMRRVVGNVGAARRSPMVCLGSLLESQKVVRPPPHHKASDGFCSFTTSKKKSEKLSA